MKVTSVELLSGDSSVISFSLTEASQDDKYMIKAVIGLDAEELTPKFYGYGSTSGSRHHKFMLKDRELIFRVVLNPNYYINESYSSIRDDLYRAVSATRSGLIKVLLKSGPAAVAAINGFITKFEVPHMSEIPELQITITCDDPLFRGYSPVDVPSSMLTGDSINIADSISTAPHGFTASLTYSSSTPSFYIRNSLEDDLEWEFEVIPNGGFVSGDVLYIGTEYGERHLYMDRSSTITHLMDKITAGSQWPTIFPGENRFNISNSSLFSWGAFSYNTAFWGV